MASVFEKYPNLPGFLTEFKDGGLQYRTEQAPPETESILFLGTAVDGPIGEPIAVDPQTVETVFGRATTPSGLPNGSTLVKAFYEAYDAGARDIRLMRVTGSTAKAEVKGRQITRTLQTPKAEVVGYTAGNAEVTFELNQHEIDTATVIVNADGVDLATDAFLVVNGDALANTFATVTLNANVTNQEAAVYISYNFVDAEGNTQTVTENGKQGADGTVTYYIASGASVTFPLSAAPKSGTLKVYADGIEVAGEAITVEGEGFALASGFTTLGQMLEATYVEESTTTEQVVVKLESIFGGSVYNQIRVEVKDVKGAGDAVVGKKIVVTKPESKKAQVTERALEYSSVDYPSFLQLVQAINADANNNVVVASVAKRHELYETKELETTTLFTGGNDGLEKTKQDLFEALGGERLPDGTVVSQGAYQLLENYTADIIVPLGVFADDVLLGKYDNFASQLALACAVISHRNAATLGLIATSSPDEAGLAAVQEHVQKLLAHKNDYFMRDRLGNVLKDSEGNNIDLGRFIEVVAGPDVVISNQRLGTYAENTVAGYAGFVSQLPAQSSPTNKVLPNGRGLRFRYSNAQLDKLTEARYVTFRLKNNGANVAVTDAPTAAQPASDYRRLTTIRVTKEVVNQVREVCDPYIGEPNETAQRNAMSAAISKRLDQLKEAGVIIGSEFNVVVTPQMQLMGEAQIELTVVPPQELRKVTTLVSLRATL